MKSLKAFSLVIVDDHQTVRQLVRKVAEVEGFLCFEAENAEEGLEVILDKKPQLAILDVRMNGDKDGFELCKLIKETVSLNDTYVCLMTSLSRKEDLEKGHAAQADAYVVKPFKLTDLKEVMNESKKGRDAKQLIKS